VSDETTCVRTKKCSFLSRHITFVGSPLTGYTQSNTTLIYYLTHEEARNQSRKGVVCSAPVNGANVLPNDAGNPAAAPAANPSDNNTATLDDVNLYWL
jgi:hypothetical protein